MSVKYEYHDITSDPGLERIHTEVAASEMTDKNIEGCRWDETPALLQVWWTEELSALDKTMLDGIVAGA